MRGEMPVLLTLPIRFARRTRVPRRSRRRTALVSAFLIVLGIVLVVVGF